MKSHSSNCVCSSTFRERIAIHYPQLKTICRAKESKQKELLKNVNNCLLQYICDCSKGVLHHHIRVPPRTYKKLSQYKDDLLLLANKQTSIRAKRAAIENKRGGFLSLILPALASALFGFIGNLVSKKLIK